MNSYLANLLSKMNKRLGIENPLERQTRKIGHEATPQKRVRKKYSLTNAQKKLAERKEKKARKIAYQSCKINRLRG